MITKQLVENAALAADAAAIAAVAGDVSQPLAQVVRRILAVALWQLEENGLITVVPSEQWPEFIITPSLDDIKAWEQPS